MASTNHTSNYELSQFIGTDKPAWLGDYNSDMGKIDAQMKLNSNSASTADGKATSNATAIGTLANLTTDVKTDLVSAINEVDNHADSATTTATSATATATSALSASATNATAIQAIDDYLNLSVNNRYSGSQFTATSGSGTPDSTSFLYIARNAEGSLCKIYGTILITNAGTGSTTFKLNADTGLRPTEAINLVGVGFANSVGTGSIANLNTKINTDGTIEFTCYHDSATYYMRSFACLIFVKNFGDTPQV